MQHCATLICIQWIMMRYVTLICIQWIMPSLCADINLHTMDYCVTLCNMLQFRERKASVFLEIWYSGSEAPSCYQELLPITIG